MTTTYGVADTPDGLWCDEGGYATEDLAFEAAIELVRCCGHDLACVVETLPEQNAVGQWRRGQLILTIRVERE